MLEYSVATVNINAELPDGFGIETCRGEYRDMSAIRHIRQLCWPGVYAEGVICDDGFDADAQHWMISQGGTLVAAARKRRSRILGIRLYKKVHVFRKTGLRVKDDREAAYDQIPNPMGMEGGQKVFVILVHRAPISTL